MKKPASLDIDFAGPHEKSAFAVQRTSLMAVPNASRSLIRPVEARQKRPEGESFSSSRQKTVPWQAKRNFSASRIFLKARFRSDQTPCRGGVLPPTAHASSKIFTMFARHIVPRGVIDENHRNIF